MAQLDKLVADGKLTPALMLTTAKMYMSVKESPYVEEEVKDIMAHLYWKVRRSGANKKKALHPKLDPCPSSIKGKGIVACG